MKAGVALDKCSAPALQYKRDLVGDRRSKEEGPGAASLNRIDDAIHLQDHFRQGRLELIMTLKETLLACGYPQAQGLACNGEFQRFDRGATLNGWFIGRRYNVQGKEHIVVRFGDWRTGEQHTWRSTDAATLSPEEKALLEAEIEKNERADAHAREQQKHEAQRTALALWDQGIDRGTTPYLAKKGLPDDTLFGARLDPENPQALLVPLRDVEGTLWSLQKIFPDGSKAFLPKGRIKGCFFWVDGESPSLQSGQASRADGADGRLSDQSPEQPPSARADGATGGGDNALIYITEGYATAASIRLATGRSHPVACAFNAGNLEAVARTLRERWPEAQLVVAGDNDRFTKNQSGTPWNPGAEKAYAAAQASRATVVLPDFGDDPGRGTDFNDLHVLRGLAEVRRQLVERPKPGSGSVERGPGLGEVRPLPPLRNKKGEPKPRPQQDYADALLQVHGARLVVQDRDLFGYMGTHWKLFGTLELAHLRQQIQVLTGGTSTAAQVDSIFKLFVTGLRHVPEGVNLFTPPPMAANFLNGTLFLTKNPDRTYGKFFREHRQEDWMINVLPYQYKEGDTSQNEEFLAMLQRVFEGDADKDEKIVATQELFACCLVPAWPHLFMLYGPPGTGKSTVIKLAARLAHPDNTCSVDPTDFEGFNMESMAGKLVNFDTDIEVNKPISEKHIKKIEDRLPFRIRRKGVKDIYAPIPATHIFGGNSIPKTLDGVSKAHDRRWTFIGFDRIVAKGNYDKDYHDYVFELGPQGILNFALAGLDRLLKARGHFSNPTSGKAKMVEWQQQTDPVGQFISECVSGHVADKNTTVKLGPTCRVKQSQLWAYFVTWHLEVYRREPSITRFKFYSLIRDKGYPTVIINGYDHFSGIGVQEVAGAAF